jgi:hypothetical protein
LSKRLLIASKSLREEFDHRLTQIRVEELGVEAHFAFEQSRIALSVAPTRQLASCHLIERYGQCISLSVDVPAQRFAATEKGFQIGSGTGANVVEGGAREREVEQDHAQRLVLPKGPNADIVGLEISMGNADLF